MKHPILAATVTLGLACVASASAAQDQTTELQNVTVTGTQVPYAIYVVDFDMGYGLQAYVGHTHQKYMQAQRAAAKSEALRKQGLAQSPYVTVAIDNSGFGVARQIQLIDADRNTVAIVNVYCKGVAPAQGSRCMLISQPVPNNTYRPRVASTLSAITLDTDG